MQWIENFYPNTVSFHYIETRLRSLKISGPLNRQSAIEYNREFYKLLTVMRNAGGDKFEEDEAEYYLNGMEDGFVEFRARFSDLDASELPPLDEIANELLQFVRHVTAFHEE